MPGLLTFTHQPPWLGDGFAALWTIQVEIWFYLVMPLAMLFLGKQRGLLIVSAVLISSSALLFVRPSDAPSLLRWGAALALGSLVSLIWKTGGIEGLHLRPMILASASLVGIGLLLIFPPVPMASWTVEVMVASVCGCGLIVAFLLQPSMPVATVAAWVGRISYSMYLIHGIALDFPIYWHLTQLHGLHLMPLPVAFACVVVALSAASHYWIEKPGIRAGKLLSSFLFKRQSALA